MSVPKSLLTRLRCRRFSTASAVKQLPKIPNVPTKYKSEAFEQAQSVLTEYLHTTRSLPFTYAEHISNNALFSISNLIKKLPFSAPNFSKTFQKLLRYHPINEFEFFFESIGIEYSHVPHCLTTNNFFFTEDQAVLDTACALSAFGFPWNMLGKMYREESCVFRESCQSLKARLDEFKKCGWGSLAIVGMCLAFPRLLIRNCKLGGDDDVVLLDELKLVFAELGVVNCVEGNVDTWYGVCRKVRVFYDLGVEKGIGELFCRKKDFFLQYPEEMLVKKANYFCKLGVRKEEIALLLLQRPEILNLELEKPIISALGFLRHLGLEEKELEEVRQKFPYVIGRNNMANVPHLMMALDLHEWFFTRIKNEHQLLANYVLSDSDEEDVKNDFRNGLEKILSSKTHVYAMTRLNFMHSIGFGENASTLKVLGKVHGRTSELEKRFDILLRAGVEFSQICLLLSTTPRIFNQNPEYLEEKVQFLCSEMDTSLELLKVFPAYLCFSLDNRIKPRYRFYAWLTKMGLKPEMYSISTMIATSEKKFVAQAFAIHPAAPKHWFERFLV